MSNESRHENEGVTRISLLSSVKCWRVCDVFWVEVGENGFRCFPELEVHGLEERDVLCFSSKDVV